MKILSVLLLVLGANYSFAGHHSEALWQAHGGQNVINAGYAYNSTALNNKDSGFKGPNIKTHTISLNYERGLNDMFSLGLGLDFISGSVDIAGLGNVGSGLNHINLFFKGNSGVGFGHLHYGLEGRIGLSDIEFDKDGEWNGSMGRNEIEPFVGLMMGDKKTMTYGAKLAYQFNTTETTVDETNTSKEEDELDGGNIFKAQLFLEKTLTDKSVFGLALNYHIQEYQEDEDKADAGSELNTFKIDAYGAVNCGCDKMNLTFLPKFSYIMAEGENDDEEEVESTGGSFAVEFAVRKEF